jgi:hypothetical protein
MIKQMSQIGGDAMMRKLSSVGLNRTNSIKK